MGRSRRVRTDDSITMGSVYMRIPHDIISRSAGFGPALRGLDVRKVASKMFFRALSALKAPPGAGVSGGEVSLPNVSIIECSVTGTAGIATGACLIERYRR
jgi:hypothetical protein